MNSIPPVRGFDPRDTLSPKDLSDALPLAEVPASFSTAWRSAVQKEAQHMQKETHESHAPARLETDAPVAARTAANAEVPPAAHPAARRERRAGHARAWRNAGRAAIAAAAVLVLVIGAALTGENNPARVVVGGNGTQTAATDMPTSKLAASRAANANLYMADMTAEDSMEMAEAAPAAAPMPAALSAGAGNSAGSDGGTNGVTVDTSASRAKIIRTANYTLATLAFDEDIEALKALVTSYGGYCEYLNVRGDKTKNQRRTASIDARVPSAQLDAFLTGVSAIGRVTGSSQTSTDVSVQYADTQTRLATQRAKLERLTALMTTAAELSDLIELESAIADTQYTIDAYEQSLRGMDSRVDYSEVSITLQEESQAAAARVEERSLLERMRIGLADTLENIGGFFQNLAVFLVSALPVIVPVGLLAWLLCAMIRRRARRARRADDALRADDAPKDDASKE